MIVAGLFLVLVGFALMAPRGGLPGATAARNISLGRTTLFRTRGYQDVPSRKYRVIQVLMGLVVMAGGFVLIAVST
jgi:hypothetical protein